MFLRWEQNHRELWKLFCMWWMSLWTLLVFVCSCMCPIKWKSPRGTSPTRTTRASRRKRRSNGRKRLRKSNDCSPTPGQCYSVSSSLGVVNNTLLSVWIWTCNVWFLYLCNTSGSIAITRQIWGRFYCGILELAISIVALLNWCFFLHSTLLHVLYTCTK